MEVTANGKTFTFPEGTSADDIGAAIDEYFTGSAQQAQPEQAQPQQQPQSPSMMDNVEQAARGLVNIPFDILQGGANLINAGSSAAGLGNVIDPVYRPVDRPKDPWAQAGEAAGSYMVPGAGVAGNMLIGSVAETANQEGDFALNATQNATLNAGVHGLLSVAGKGINRAFRGGKEAPPTPSGQSADSGSAASPSSQAEAARAAQGVTDSVNPRPTEEAIRKVAAQRNPDIASSLEGLDVRPQQDVMDAAGRLGVDSLLPSHLSGNAQYQAVEQAIKSRTGSALRVQEDKAISELASGAGKIIDDIAGAPDALAMSDRYISQINGRMSALQSKSDRLYARVDNAIAPSARIEAPSTSAMLEREADNLGGWENLDGIESKVFKAVSPGPEGVLTYANLNKQRRLVGEALHKNRGPYKDADRRALSQLYGSLAEDQKLALSGSPALREFEVAQRLVQMRKTMEDQMVSLRGNTLNGDITYKATNALQAMAKGNGKGFRELMENTQSRQLKAELIGTALRDMLSAGKRGADFNPAGFADWWQNMQASGQIREMARYLPKDKMAGLYDTYKVARAIKNAKAHEITTGKLNEFTERFNRVTVGAQAVSDYAQRAGAMAGSYLGPLGAVAGSEIGARISRRALKAGGAGSMDAADKLISSPQFQTTVKKLPSSAPDHIIDTRVRRVPGWSEFYNSLPDKDKKTITRLGMAQWIQYEMNEDGL